MRMLANFTAMLSPSEIPLPAAATKSAPGSVMQVMTLYVASWDAADPKALASLFAVNGDLIAPDGRLARGAREIEAFYAAAFAAGYAGSKGGFRLDSYRLAAPNIAIVDGGWSIDGARHADGSARPPESGLATAVLVWTRVGWRVAALREHGSAKPLTPLD